MTGGDGAVTYVCEKSSCVIG